jgi:hypothetical protein
MKISSLMHFYIIFKSVLPTSQKTYCLSVTKTSWILLFREIIAEYTENCTDLTNIMCGENREVLTAKANSKYGYYYALKD